MAKLPAAVLKVMIWPFFGALPRGKVAVVFTSPRNVRWNTGLLANAVAPLSVPVMVSVPEVVAAAPLALPPHPAASSPIPAARAVAPRTVLFTRVSPR